MEGRIMPGVRLIAVVALALFVLPACGGDEGEEGGTGEATTTTASGPSTVAIALQEFAVSADPRRCPRARSRSTP